MHEQNWNFENEQDFEILLRDSLPELPPSDVVQGITPWKKATNRILTGMALCSVTLNFWCLNYILPTIGMILILLGFRALRKENKWFQRGWTLVVIRMFCFLVLLIMNAAIFRSTSYGKNIYNLLFWGNSIILFFMCLTLWKGFREVQKKADLPPRANGAIALLFWYLVICALGLIGYSDIIIGIILVVAYILILRSLYKMSKELDEAGYAVQTAVVQIAEGLVVTVILGILTVGIGCGYLFYNKYPMDWEEVSSQMNSEQTGVENAAGLEEIKTHLVQLGFPEIILEDLKEEDIFKCKDALRLVVNMYDHPVNEGRIVQELIDGTYVRDTVYDVKELRITGIGVELPGEREQWKIFHHFQWTTNPGFCGTESIQIWPTTRLDEGWMESEDMTGQILYDDDGKTYISSYYSLQAETYASTSIFFGEQTNHDLFATFSFPNGVENHRGYLSYTVEEVADGCIIDSWINYTHQMYWFQYPVLTAKEKRMVNGWNDAGAFKTIQDALQFYPNDEELKTFE